MPCILMLTAAHLTTLASRREEISKKNLQLHACTTSFHNQENPRFISRLRTYQKYPRVYPRTKRYCSFIHYALNYYQDSISNH